MRRFWVTLLILATVIAMGLPAVAAPPKCVEDPTLPGCGGGDDPTTTTTEAPPELAPCPNEMTIAGKATTHFTCLWKPIDNGSPTATVTISQLTPTIKEPPTLWVRDDAPGDICVLLQGDEWDPPTENGYEASFDLFYDEVPEGYEAWLGHSYWDFKLEEGMEDGTHWCAPQDPILSSQLDDTNGGDLHVKISFNATKGGSLHFTLEPANSLLPGNSP